jgi:adenylate kinase
MRGRDFFSTDFRQVEALDGILAERGARLDAVVNIILPEEVCRDRLIIRAQREGRPDDAFPKAVQERFRLYRSQSRPCLARYRLLGIVHDIDGLASVDAVFDRIASALALGERTGRP